MSKARDRKVALLAELDRLLTTYAEHRHSDDPDLRRRVHVELDRFLMEHRDIAAMYMQQGLTADTRRRGATWARRLLNYKPITERT